MLRDSLGRLWLRGVEANARAGPPYRAEAAAIVFSPHFDDETLAAGGTLIQKRRRGGDVRVVFMTDGSASHASLIDGQELARVRWNEALEAARALGIPAESVTCLGLPETRLAHHRQEAIRAVTAVLREQTSAQVFIPSGLEPLLWSADHRETRQIVLRALADLGQPVEIVEYLVWYWYHWPWVPIGRGSEALRLARLTIQNGAGASAWRQLNTAVCISDALEQKRVALGKYRSQMLRPDGIAEWPVLTDVCGGAFLERLLQPTEFFKRHAFRPRAR